MSRPRFAACGLLASTILSGAAAGEHPKKLLPKGFITAVTAASDGTIWAADEENSLFRVFRGTPHRVRGPADKYCYAMAEDAKGRLWVGTGRHGVSVHDGRAWRTLGPEKGLAGYHVYSILPASDGSVWIGTEGGTSRIGRDGELTTLRTEDGLPSNEVSDIVEDKQGNIWFAGFVGGAARLDKGTRKITRIPERLLATSLLNDLYVDSSGRLWLSGQGGITLLDPARMRPLARFLGKKSRVAARRGVFRILPDDYVRCVCEKTKGEFYVGTRRKGLWLLNLDTMKMSRVKGFGRDFVFAMARGGDGSVFVGAYGGGLTRIGTGSVSPSLHRPFVLLPEIKRSSGGANAAGIFPAALARLKETPGPTDASGVAQGASAVYVGEGWRTRGDWIGRYGKFLYILCAMNPPFDFYGGEGGVNTSYKAYIGEHRKRFPLKAEEIRPEFRQGAKVPKNMMVDDGIRYWIHWLHTDNPKCLQVPKTYGGGRTQAEWDDHGEAYPFDWVGPHLYFDLLVSEDSPEHPGMYLLSLYFMNKDGHQGNNRFRDYLITVKRILVRHPMNENPRGWERVFDRLPVLASARVHDFRGGVYKQFLIREGAYTIKIDRNGSFNTILSGVFLDKVAGEGGERVTYGVRKDSGPHGATLP